MKLWTTGRWRYVETAQKADAALWMFTSFEKVFSSNGPRPTFTFWLIAVRFEGIAITYLCNVANVANIPLQTSQTYLCNVANVHCNEMRKFHSTHAKRRVPAKSSQEPMSLPVTLYKHNAYFRTLHKQSPAHGSEFRLPATLQVHGSHLG